MFAPILIWMQTSSLLIEDAVYIGIAAKDASEALQNFARLLESKRKYLDGQLEVSAYTYISNFLLLRIGFRRRDSYTSLIKAIN